MPMAVWYEFYVHTYLSEQLLAPSTIVRGEVDMHVVVLGRQRFLHERFAEHFTTHHYSILSLAHFICSGEGRGGKGLLSLHLISLQCVVPQQGKSSHDRMHSTCGGTLHIGLSRERWRHVNNML